MTNEELKKKIIEIISPYVVERWHEHIADALIAAGICDVTEWKEKAKKHRVQVLPDGTIKQLYSDEEVEDIARQRDEYKHRAARAERAFSKLVHEMYEHGIRPMCDEKFFVESRLKDAEKELAEERKDDNK